MITGWLRPRCGPTAATTQKPSRLPRLRGTGACNGTGTRPSWRRASGVQRCWMRRRSTWSRWPPPSRNGTATRLGMRSCWSTVRSHTCGISKRAGLRDPNRHDFCNVSVGHAGVAWNAKKSQVVLPRSACPQRQAALAGAKFIGDQLAGASDSRYFIGLEVCVSDPNRARQIDMPYGRRDGRGDDGGNGFSSRGSLDDHEGDDAIHKCGERPD